MYLSSLLLPKHSYLHLLQNDRSVCFQFPGTLKFLTSVLLVNNVVHVGSLKGIIVAVWGREGKRMGQDGGI